MAAEGDTGAPHAYPRPGRRSIALAGAWIALVGACLLAFTVNASAAPPDLLVRIFNGQTAFGSGVGQLALPAGVVADPDNGHLFVTDSENSRVNEYNPWGLFVRSWGWGVSDGSPEAQVCEPDAPTDVPPPGLCQPGIAGTNEGQLREPRGIAMDAAGDIYVFELTNLRVQKFSPEGEFIVMFGGAVNKTKVEEGAPAAEQNRCPVDLGDECQIGTAGSAPGHFATGLFRDVIEYSPASDAILVGDNGRIQEFNPDGTLKDEIPFSGELATFAGKDVEGLDVDAAGNAYLTIVGLADAYKLDPGGAPLDPGKPGESEFDAASPGGVTVDHNGNVFVIDGTQVLGYNAAGERFLPTAAEEEEGAPPFPGLAGNPQLRALTTNFCAGSEEPGNLYVSAYLPSNQSHVNAYGSPPIGCEPPPSRPPQIAAQYTRSVRTDAARVRAEINPRFWADTRYFVQYGEGKCSEGGCEEEQPLAPGALLTDRVLSEALATETVILQGLEPGTTYHYRFVAQSGGGGPVYGEGGGEQLEAGAFREVGGEDSFRTPALPGEARSCPASEELRSGLAAALPDCRAYELVSPLDKDNGDAAFFSLAKHIYERYQSAASGERFTYSSLTPFAEPAGAPFASQFLASRDPDAGWSNEHLAPPRSASVLEVARALPNEFKAFSDDLCTGWLLHNSASPLSAEAVPGYANLYRGEHCGEERAYEALSTAAPPVRPPDQYSGLSVMGFSADETKTAFLSEDALTPDAPVLNEGVPSGVFPSMSLYLHGPSGLRYACYLPSGAPVSTACGAGMSAIGEEARGSTVQGALSADGARLFWTAYEGNLNLTSLRPGTIYLRVNPDEAESAHEFGGARGSGDLTGPVSCSGDTQSFGKTINDVKCSAGFVVGQPISGPGIAAGTVVSEVPSASQLKIDKAATATLNDTALSGPASAVVRNVVAEFGAFEPGQEISGPGIAAGTTVEAVSPGEGTLTLSAPAVATVTDAELEATSECTEAQKACTIPVSGPVSSAAGEYWGAAEDGSRAIFKIVGGPKAGEVYEFDTATESAHLIAEGGIAPMGMSEDASRLYFASSEVLGAGGSEGALDGARNLYLYEAEGAGVGSFDFIAALAASDVGGTELRPAAAGGLPNSRSSAVSPDGLHAAFGSSASPTGYDNHDAESGVPAEEVYLYDAATQELVCASCDPSGARPLSEQKVGASVAARLAVRRVPLQVPRNLAEDGRRLFFESYGPLVPRDTNGTWDVYQWEAVGKGDCEASRPTHNPGSDGCVDLISTGRSPSGARFLDADASGANVFIGTQESLVKADPGQNDVYVARVGGGFPEPPPAQAGCEGEACQSPPPAPPPPAPASAAFRGPGDPTPAPGCGSLGRRAKQAARRAREARSERAARRLSRRARALAKRGTRCRRAARRAGR